jgi:hypothetical protein
MRDEKPSGSAWQREQFWSKMRRPLSAWADCFFAAGCFALEATAFWMKAVRKPLAAALPQALQKPPG